jgi:hypothetical protein
MKSKYQIMFFTLMFIFTGFISAQSIVELEKKYEQLSFQYEIENSIVDSLKNLFSKKADQIDREKKKDNPDQEIIVDLMAGSTTISAQLENRSKKLNKIEADLENVKKQLHKIYVSKLDSLESLKKTAADEDEINNEIISFIAKNLLVTPKVLTFSFNPSKVLNIDLNKVNDTREKKLYKDYLDNAYNEVDLLLQNILTQSAEVDEMIDLQNKTKKFLEEAELESKVLIQSRSVVSSAEPNPTFNGRSGIANESIELSKQIYSYQLILRQLDIEQLSKKDIKWDIAPGEINKSLSLKDYQSLLNEVKKRLQEYKLVLANKIGSSR